MDLIIKLKNISWFLETRFLDFGIIFLTYWSIVHFFTGILLMWIISAKNKSHYKYPLLLELLMLWELFEIFSYYTLIQYGVIFFIMEPVSDILLDIMVGMFGGLVYTKFFKKANAN